MCNLPESHVKQLIEENALLKKEAAKIPLLEKRVEDLEKRLNIYENPHVPSSKRIIKPSAEEPDEPKEPKKRGAPEGHKGATRKPPVPNRLVDLRPDKCPKCLGKDITILRQHSRIVEDVQVIKVNTQFTVYDFACSSCGKTFTTTDKGLPKEGSFGPNILSLWSMLHYYGTVPFERLSLISRNCFGVDISPPGLMNSVYQTAEVFEPQYNRIEDRITQADYVRSDETPYPFNGERYWLWNISTQKDTLVKIRDSRGSKVLKEVFGDFLDAVLNSDCFSAYEKFKAREYQKCWAHILGDAKDLAKHNQEGKELHRRLDRMYQYIKRAKEAGLEDTPAVKRWKQRQKREILSWLQKVYESKAVSNLVLRMKKYLDQWFTCLKYPEVEPTNNGSEREIRKSVNARKISGQHRSKEGLHSREIMTSVLITWQKRGRNSFEFVQQGIEKYNSRIN